ncbi:GNAT family N-acetyltransferase [Luteolibacter yonseiensis]|uniref:GNAT family N-acetyltransferase n=1 Tax=Luteolibacter yonseiensis TaxID=1144680 RepID=A0A934R4Y3_9BACT|nr:GNAT family N-acetyltransferase [Luteolibacter yonseiensis]MBK1817241.1 GNAT family N-acetyltransferase [Luteolibacter yonseiensis]
MEIHHPATDDEINACFAVISELRPHLKKDDFLPQVRRQEIQGYRMVTVREGGVITSVAGYRITEFLIWGKFLYVDDLVTAGSQRGRGNAGALLSWIIGHARETGCNNVQLDSGFTLHPAHRLYHSKGFHLACHHFKHDIHPTPDATRP